VPEKKRGKRKMTIEQLNNMSRAELVSALVEAGVSKWGEGERGGLESMYAAQSEAKLRGSIAIAQKIEGKIKGDRQIKKAAGHCNERGVS
jgi:hypothetical protein